MIWTIMIDSSLPSDTYTFMSDAWNTTSWLDHCFATQYTASFITLCHVVYQSFNSDHLPIAFNIDVSLAADKMLPVNTDTIKARVPRIELSKIAIPDRSRFQACVVENLNSINLNDYDVLCCKDSDCHDSSYLAQIDNLYSKLVSCLSNAAITCFGQPIQNRQFCKSIPGWNDVRDTREAANDAYQLWHTWNKPRSGPIFQLRQRTRATYKYAIRSCRRHEQEMVAEAMTTDLTKHDYHAFGKELTKQKTPFTTFATNVGNTSGPTAICEIGFQHYNSLFNSIGFTPAAHTFNNNMPDNLITVSGSEISTVLNNMHRHRQAQTK